ncbi:MAG: hypothetical protein LC624_10670 [Halobacteriales archaeon]|nr:hypothetical protein [Halobacteriales archaeon]
MDARPSELLGLPVLDPSGLAVGTVVDVGLVDHQRPKFLLVRWNTGASIQRVELQGIAVGPAGVRLPRLPS